MLEQELGRGNANVATSLLLEAAVALCCDQAAYARDCAEQALEIRAQAHGPGSKEAAAAMCTLADALRDVGRCAPHSVLHHASYASIQPFLCSSALYEAPCGGSSSTCPCVIACNALQAAHV